MSETRCRSCNAPIRFERTASGKLTPIALETGEPHWIDCPERREWRKAETPTQASFLDPDEAPPAEPTHRRHYE